MPHTPKNPTDTNLEPGSNPEPLALNLEPGSNLEPASNPDLLDYIEIIIKRWRMIVGITIASTLITVIYSLTLPNIYTAKTKFLPPQQQAGLLSAAMMQGALASAIGGSDLLGESKSSKLYTELLKIEALRDKIVERFKLQEVYKNKYRQDTYKALNKYVSIQAGKEGIITISVDDKDPKRSADMANAFVDELKKLATSMSITGANNSKAFLEERIVKAKVDLTGAENDLKAFQQKYKTLDATQQGAASAGALAALTAQLTSQEIQLDVSRRTFSETSQEIKTIKRSIGVIKDKIAKLQSAGGTGNFTGFDKIPERGQEYMHLMRRFKTAESVYEMLVKQYEVARLNAENDVSTIQVIQKALVPERKSKPARSKIVQMALFVALFGSLLIAFLLEYLSRMPEGERKRWGSLLRTGDKKTNE